MNTSARNLKSIDRIWRLVMLAAFMVGLLASPPTGVRAALPIGLVFNSPAGASDMGFNYWADRGLDAAESDVDLSVDGTQYTPVGTAYADYVAELQACAASSVLCIAVADWFDEMAKAVFDVASDPTYAGVHFAILNYSYGTYPASDNVRGILFAPKAMGYLAGALAARQFPGANLGVVAGPNILPVQKFVDGFRNGAQCANVGTEVWAEYTGSFADDGSGVTAAANWIDLGASAIYTVAGPNGDAALLYSTQYHTQPGGRDVYGIGVDTDQYLDLFGEGAVTGADHLLSSTMMGMDWAVYKTIADEVASAFTTGEMTFGLGGGFGLMDEAFEGGARLAPYHDVTVNSAITTYLNGVEAGIQAGDIDIDYPCQPRFHAEIVENRVTAMEWLPGIELTLTINDPETGPGGDYTDTEITDVWGNAQFTGLEYAGGVPLQLTSGMIVTVSGTIPQAGGLVTTSLTIDDIQITNVDTVHDTVSGTAPPGAEFSSQYCDMGCSWRRYTTADSFGNWTANFSVPDPAGTTPEEENTLDIYPGIVGETLWGHPEGGITDVQWRGAEAGARMTENFVDGYGWPMGATVHLNINGAVGYDADATVVEAPWESGLGWARFTLGEDWTLAAGDHITLADDWTSKELTVSPLAVTEIVTDDGLPNADTVSGTVESDESWVEVYAHCGAGGCESYRHVIPIDAGANYSWSANLHEDTGLLPGEWGKSNLEPGSAGEVYFHDYDGDFTLVQWYAPNPRFIARANQDWIEVYDYELGATVDIDIYDPANGPDVDEHASVVMGSDPWNPGGTYGEWTFGSFDITAGMTVTTSSTMGPTKTHLVTALEITDWDVLNDRFGGSTTAYADVQANVCRGSEGCVNRWIMADEDGFWGADFSVESMPGAADTWDIRPGDWIDSHELDTDTPGPADGDETAFGVEIPRPTFTVRANDDRVEAYNFANGATATLEIDDLWTPQDPDYSEAKLIDQTTPDGQSYVEFNLDGVFDIFDGMEVSLADGVTIKTHTVTGLKITRYNLAENTFGGTALSGVHVWANVCDGECDGLEAVANTSNQWDVDLDDIGWPDLELGDWIDSHDADEDGDETAFGIGLARPVFTVRPDDNMVEAVNFPMSWEVRFYIDKYPTDGIEECTIFDHVEERTPWGSGETYHAFDPSLCVVPQILEPGDLITITDESTEKTHTVTELQLTSHDLVNDTFGGKAAPFSSVETYACDNDGSGCSMLIPSADESGDWLADYAGIDDLGAGYWLDSSQPDPDGDATNSGFQVPTPSFAARLPVNEVHGYGWELGVPVTLSMEVGPITYEDTAIPVVADWDPNETVVVFDLDSVELQGGYYVTLSQQGLVKTHLVRQLDITDMDFLLDTMQGTVSWQSEVEVDANCGATGCEAHRDHHSDGDNLWAVDFVGLGVDPDEQTGANLTTGSEGEVRSPDNDGDFTALHWQGAPFISGNAGAAGVTLTWLDGDLKTFTSNADGSYYISVPFGWSGTITPSKTGYAFEPLQTSYTYASSFYGDQDFVAFAPTRYPDAALPQVCRRPAVGARLLLTDLMRLPSGAFNPAAVTLMVEGQNRMPQATVITDVANPTLSATIRYVPTADLPLGTRTASITFPVAAYPYGTTTTTYSWTFNVTNIACTSAMTSMPVEEEIPPATLRLGASIEAPQKAPEASAGTKAGEAALQPRQRRDQ